MGDRGERRERDNNHRRYSAPQDGRHDRPTSGPGGGFNKRKRDFNAEPRDDFSRLLSSIFRVGDNQQVRAIYPHQQYRHPLCLHPPSKSLVLWAQEQHAAVLDLHRSLRRDIQYSGEMVRRILCPCRRQAQGCLARAGRSHSQHLTQVRNIILDCAMELSPKTPVYATLVGALRSSCSYHAARCPNQAA